VDLVQNLNERHREADVVADARAWLKSTDTSYLYSFEFICLALNLEPTGIRRKVLGGTAVYDAKRPRHANSIGRTHVVVVD
jgi:hypothetical protein